jgi:hypothetical protein
MLGAAVLSEGDVSISDGHEVNTPAGDVERKEHRCGDCSLLIARIELIRLDPRRAGWWMRYIRGAGRYTGCSARHIGSSAADVAASANGMAGSASDIRP